MAPHKQSLRTTQRQTTLALVAVNLLGASVAFLYFNVIAPLLEGQAAARTVSWIEIVSALVLIALPIVSGFAWSRKRDERVTDCYERLRSGTPSYSVPLGVRRDVLTAPMCSAVLNEIG